LIEYFMTTAENPSPAPAPAAPSATRRTRLLGSAGIAIGLVLLGVGAAIHLAVEERNDEVTEDAYVEGNIVQVTPQLSGSVTTIAADNTDYVQAGQVLVQLNPVDARLALERAESQLAKAVRQVRAQFATSTQMQASVVLRQADLARVEADLQRRRQLAGSGAIAGEDVVHAEDAVKNARAALTMAAQQSLGAQAMVDGTGIADHPEVQNAIAQLRDAYVANARTVLRAPVSGVVGKRNVQLGQRVAAGSVLMVVVPPGQMWVSANFKESQLRHIRIGQPVQLSADAYGNSVLYHGRVVGQDAGTGSAFSLMPAQNASGNWIKVVQRVPVRVALDAGELAAHPLTLGLSMRASVDTSDRKGVLARYKVNPAPQLRTAVFDHELEQADQMVRKIIAASLGRDVHGSADSRRPAPSSAAPSPLASLAGGH